MNCIVVYKTKYGSTGVYARHIAECLGCECVEAKQTDAEKLAGYDCIVYGGGLYAEVINGLGLITKNTDKLSDKKIVVFTTGITPRDCREYYDDEVLKKNFKNGVPSNIRIFNFLGKMKMEELTVPHKAALVALKKIMTAKKNPSDMEKLLIELCDFDDDLTNLEDTRELIEYVKAQSL